MATKQETKDVAADEQETTKQDDKTDESKEQLDLGALDACLTSTTLKVGIGLLGGFLGSMIVRKRWPIVVGLGFGVGESIGCCREDFKEEDGDGGKTGGKGTKPDDTKGGKDKAPDDTKGGKGTVPDDTKGGKGKVPDDTKGGKGTVPDDTKGGKGKVTDDTKGGKGKVTDDTKGGKGTVPDGTKGEKVK